MEKPAASHYTSLNITHREPNVAKKVRTKAAEAQPKSRKRNTARRRGAAVRPNLPERILDMAEEMFGRYGFGGTTTRAIARRAGVNVGQLHYYFDSKRAIFEAVVGRIGREVTERRRMLLNDAAARHEGGAVPLHVLVDSLVRPLLLPQASADRQRASLQLHARLFTDPDETANSVRAGIYDETNALYVAAIRRSLPQIPADTLSWRYYFMMGSYVWTLLQPGRLEAISEGRCDPADMESAVREIVPFLCAGLSAPVAG